MDSSQGSDDTLFQNSIKYLYEISNLPTLNVPALKSFYSTKGRLMELRSGIHLPSNVTRASVRCQKCFLNLLDGPALYQIKAEQKKSKFARRLLAKSQRNKPMTKFQREYLKRFNNFSGNKLAITCKFCKKESLIKLQKPKRDIRPKVVTVLPRKKKINKKDKFCGLSQEAVLSLTPQNVRDLNNSDVISLNADKNISRFKLSKKENLDEGKKIVVTKETFIQNKNKLKRKSKNLNKLGEFLNNSKNSKANSSSNLKHFLLGFES